VKEKKWTLISKNCVKHTHIPCGKMQR